MDDSYFDDVDNCISTNDDYYDYDSIPSGNTPYDPDWWLCNYDEYEQEDSY